MLYALHSASFRNPYSYTAMPPGGAEKSFGEDGVPSSVSGRVTLDDARLAAVTDCASSVHSATPVSLSFSGNNGTVTSNGDRKFHVPFGSLEQAARTANYSEPADPSEAQIARFISDLDGAYKIEEDNRIREFISKYPSGPPPEEAEFFKQRDALERTKFCIFRDAEVEKLRNSLNGVKDPFTSGPATPTPPASRRDFVVNNNHFRVTSQFPPPRLSSHDRSFKGSAAGASFGTMSSSNSIVGDSSHSDMNGSNTGSMQKVTDATQAAHGFTRDQILHAFGAIYDDVVAVRTQNAVLNDEIIKVKQDLYIKISVLEEKLSAVQNGQPLESDSALVANLASDIAKLRDEVANTLSRHVFDNENAMTKLIFNNKCALIEKYLGIDITTTGPKPHDVLEALHNRIWRLEEALPMSDPASRHGVPYKQLNEHMKTVLSRNNSTINYSATPGYRTSRPLSLITHMNGVPGPLAVERNNRPVRERTNPGTGSTFSNASTLYGPAAAAGLFADDTPLHTKFMSGNALAFTPRFTMPTTNMGVNPPSSSDDGDMLPETITELPRSSTMPDFLVGNTLIPTGPRAYGTNNPRTTPKRSSVQLKSPPSRRSRTSNADEDVSNVPDTPTKRGSGSAHSRTTSTSTAKGEAKKDATAAATTAAKAAPQQKTKDQAYLAWMNQRPGEFTGKKLSGLGQKE